jgi:chromosome segregation ATPase
METMSEEKATPHLLSEAEVQSLQYRVEHLEKVRLLKGKISVVTSKVRQYASLYKQSHNDPAMTVEEARKRQKELEVDREVLEDQLSRLESEIEPIDREMASMTLAQWLKDFDSRKQELARQDEHVHQLSLQLESATEQFDQMQVALLRFDTQVNSLRRLLELKR